MYMYIVPIPIPTPMTYEWESHSHAHLLFGGRFVYILLLYVVGRFVYWEGQVRQRHRGLCCDWWNGLQLGHWRAVQWRFSRSVREASFSRNIAAESGGADLRFCSPQPDTSRS